MSVIKIGPIPVTPGFLYGTSGFVSGAVVSEVTALPVPKKVKIKPNAPLKPVALVAKAATPGKLIRKKVF